MQNPSGSFSNVWRPSAPTLLRPYCAKKRPFVEQRIKSGRMGGFLQKGQAEAEAGAVSALGELPYTPKQDAARIWNKLVAEIILIINFRPIKKPM